MAEEKSVNYTEEMVQRMEAEYQASPTRETVEFLAEEFGKTTRSIVAKLSNLGIYKAPTRTTKAGKPVVRKAELVAQVSDALDLGVTLESLEKASKADLEALVAAVYKATKDE